MLSYNTGKCKDFGTNHGIFKSIRRRKLTVLSHRTEMRMHGCSLDPYHPVTVFHSRVKVRVKVRLKWTHSKEDTSWPQGAENVQTFPSAGFVSAKELLSCIELELLKVIAQYHRPG